MSDKIINHLLSLDHLSSSNPIIPQVNQSKAGPKKIIKLTAEFDKKEEKVFRDLYRHVADTGSLESNELIEFILNVRYSFS